MAEETVESWLSMVDVMTWLTRPSIALWAGVVAAIVAAMTIEPKTWFQSPAKSVRRASQVAVVWLVVASALCLVESVGGKHGTGGKGQAENSNDGTGSSTPPVVAVAGQFPPGAPDNADLVIRFVPSRANQRLAQSFSCDLFYQAADKDTMRIEIRARNMNEFEKLLVRQLRDLKSAQVAAGPTVQIARSPFPGENVVRKVRDQIRAACPQATVLFDE